ncbi:MAG: hypothetical protein ACQGVC_07890 [Myxococcota bacterium]
MRRVAPLTVLLLVVATHAAAQSYRYDWNGPNFSTASGTISVAHEVNGFLVLAGPVENLPFGDVAPVRFSFSAGPVTIDDATPLHPLTRIKLQTDADGEIVQAEIQLVEAIDTGGGLLAADVICAESCPAGGNQDLVIDRNALGAVIGMGEVPIAMSFWAAPTLLAPGVPAVPWPLLALGVPLAAVARRHLRHSQHRPPPASRM